MDITGFPNVVSLMVTWLHCSRLYGDQSARKDQTGVKKEWRDDVGDRAIKLVFIGKNMNKQDIIKKLNDCLE